MLASTVTVLMVLAAAAAAAAATLTTSTTPITAAVITAATKIPALLGNVASVPAAIPVIIATREQAVVERILILVVTVPVMASASVLTFVTEDRVNMETIVVLHTMRAVVVVAAVPPVLYDWYRPVVWTIHGQI